MTVGALDKRISEAIEAQEQLNEQQALEEQAAELDDLLAEKALEAELQEAEKTLANAKQWATSELSEAAEQATSWRQRFQAACTELEALAAELPKVQRRIFGAGRELHRAAQSVNSVGYEPTPVATGSFDPGTSYALRQGRGVSFSQLLAQAGGNSHRLACWPDFTGRNGAASLRWQIKELLRKRYRGGVVYDPNLGAKQF
jgi:hypothetical protein